MKFFNSLGPCRGFVLFSLFGWTIELWRIAPLYTVPDHFHSNIDNWIYYLSGEAMVAKCKVNSVEWKRVWVSSLAKQRLFHIRPCETHYIENGPKPLWLLTIQHWLDKHSDSVSVSEDITFYKS